MNRRRISMLIANILLVAMVTGLFSGCSGEKDKKERKKITKAEPTTEETDPDSKDPTDKTNGGSDQDSDPDTSSGTSSTKDPDAGGSFNDDSLPELDPDRVLFTYEYENYAWGYMSRLMVILADGRVFTTGNYLNFTDYLTDEEREMALAKKIECLTRMEPVGTMDAKWILEMYRLAYHVNPNASYTEEPVMCDYGQEVLYYWNDKGQRVRVWEEGDVKVTIDDPNCPKIDVMWDEMQTSFMKNPDAKPVDLFTKWEILMETYTFSYIELPDGNSAKYVFENYEAFEPVAEKWNLDLEKMKEDLFFSDAYNAYPIFVQIEQFSSGGHFRDYDAFVREDDSFYFLPSPDCYDPAPGDVVTTAMEGYITICIYTGDLEVTDEGFPARNGETWVKYSES